MDVSLIVCIDKQGGISKNGVIPWRIKEDNNFFVDVTRRIYGTHKKNGMVMGKNTWLQCKESIKQCEVVVVSSTMPPTEGVHVVKTLQEAAALTPTLLIDHLFICGGKAIYNTCFMHWLSINLIVTQIDHDYQCDNKINILQHITLKKYQLDTSYQFMLLDNGANASALGFNNTNKQVNVSFNRYHFGAKPKYCLDNMAERQYLALLNDVLSHGDFRQTRNAKTWSLFGKTLVFDLQQGFPLLTSKKVFFKAVVEELLWFLRGDTNAGVTD